MQPDYITRTQPISIRTKWPSSAPDQNHINTRPILFMNVISINYWLACLVRSLNRLAPPCARAPCVCLNTRWTHGSLLIADLLFVYAFDSVASKLSDGTITPDLHRAFVPVVYTLADGHTAARCVLNEKVLKSELNLYALCHFQLVYLWHAGQVERHCRRAFIRPVPRIVRCCSCWTCRDLENEHAASIYAKLHLTFRVWISRVRDVLQIN